MSLKHEKFVELAERRVNKILKQLDLIGNLSNKNNYEFNEKEVKMIVNSIKSKVREVEMRFSKQTEKKFKLK